MVGGVENSRDVIVMLIFVMIISSLLETCTFALIVNQKDNEANRNVWWALASRGMKKSRGMLHTLQAF